MVKLNFIDLERKWIHNTLYFFIELEFTSLARSSPSILDKDPHSLTRIYSGLLLVKAIFSSTLDLLPRTLEGEPSCHMP